MIGIQDDLRFPKARISPEKAIIAIGNFDGLHLGHRQLLQKVDAMAKEVPGALRRVLTFEPHPQTLLGGEYQRIYTRAQKQWIAAETELADDLITLEFSCDVMGMEPEEFYESVLVKRYHAAGIVVGSNFRFGRKGKGTAAMLKEFCLRDGLKIEIVPDVEERGSIVSSTRIKQLLLNGRMEEANALLGRNYFVEGIVQQGKQVGRTKKTPTVNVYFDKDQVVPKRGVYVSQMIADDRCYPSVTNVGCNPTFKDAFGEEKVHTETFVLDFNEDLYGKKIRVELLAFVRPEQQFESVDALYERLKTDIQIARSYFSPGGKTMKKYGVNELREMYLSFFESKEHLRMKSFSLVPQNDKSLLLINAGMAPLKPYFTGQEIPPRRRVTTCQKCIRTGDIENVGKTARHGTFFEMLGNFSFGDYFKTEALHWSWEFLTKVVGLEEDRLYPSIFLDDDQAFDVWNKEIGVPANRIYRFGKEDNFWEHGEGPCGPCSEIYYDRGEKYGCGKPDCAPGCDCDRYMEIWNNVFTQFYGDGKGGYTELEQKNIDTGMGLERLAVAVQDVDSMFDVDTMKAIRDAVCEVAGVEYLKEHKTDVSVRVISDHVRSVTFMASDGILPSNEGRGYVMRRLLRRAARHGRLLGIDHQFLTEIAKVVIDCSKDAYPELEEKKEYINKVLSSEEAKFYQTLDGGLNILQGYMDEMKENGTTTLEGAKVFKLYDTYGFPIDLTKEIVEEQGMKLDEEGFQAEMQAQRERARNAREETNYMGAKATVYNQLDPAMVTVFDGYNCLELEGAEIIAMTGENEVIGEAEKGASVTVFTDKTSLYGTMGGQVGDLGTIQTETGLVKVTSTIHAIGDKIGHVGEVVEGYISVGQKATMKADKENRMSTSRNHSATHLLQKALRNTLGSHVEQAGSYVDSQRLRFDFSHFQAMTKEEIAKVEAEVNKMILEALPIQTNVMSMEEAKKTGAMALFGEKYGDSVRVVSMGDYSVELCGGTHLTNTAQVGSFKILSENGVAAGVRRIEALTGIGALEHYAKQEKQVEEAAEALKAKKDQVGEAARNAMQQIKDLQKQIQALESKIAAAAAGDMVSQAETVGEFKVLTLYQADMDMNALKNLGDSLKDKLGECVIALACGTDKVNFVVMATDKAVKAGAHAGNIIRETAKICGGGGGGRPGMAQAGGKDASKVAEALAKAAEMAKSQLA